MAQILAIDYGKARCGIAATDDMQIIASGLDTVATVKLLDFLGNYFQKNLVESVVVGLPVDTRGNVSEVEADIQKFIGKFIEDFPLVSVERFDERYTSKMAAYFISQSGKGRKARQEKGLTDKVSATLILQNFLEYRR